MEGGSRLLPVSTMKNALSLIYQQNELSIEGDFLESLHKKTRREGEEALILAVLEDAVDCFQKYVMARDRRGATLFREAEEWILDEDADWPFSFEQICETLGIEPNYLRQELMRWKEKKLAEARKGKIFQLPPRQAEKKRAEPHSTSENGDAPIKKRRHG